jgi:DNA/RNA-binding domain of Phe-tRNA-synthetase-like protein
MSMLSIDPALKTVAPSLRVGVVRAVVQVRQHDPGLWAEMESQAARVAQTQTTESVRKQPEIQALWQAYKALGKDPTRYRSSAEALVRRIVQGKGLYQVNTVVDINNLISLETLCSVGSYDLGHVSPPVTFRIGREGEAYEGIGRGPLNIAGLPVFADQLGPCGSPTSDSPRTMIRLETTRLMMAVISFGGIPGRETVLQRAGELLKQYALARELETEVIE